jgi:hypothetical protein
MGVEDSMDVSSQSIFTSSKGGGLKSNSKNMDSSIQVNSNS